MSNIKLVKANREGKLVFGKTVVAKQVSSNKLDEIYFASNCPAPVKAKLASLANACSVKVSVLTENSEEISAELKKPFSILVLGILK